MHERKRERAARTTKDLRWNPRSQGEKKGWPVSGKAMLKNANVIAKRKGDHAEIACSGKNKLQENEQNISEGDYGWKETIP
jgi:hypothetical protein